MNDFLPTSSDRGHIRSTPRAPLQARPVVYVRPTKPYAPVINSTVATTYAAVVVRETPELIVETLVEQRTVNMTSVYYNLAKTAKRADVVSRALAIEQVSVGKKKRFQMRFKAPVFRSVTLAGLAIIILAATGYIGFDTLKTNQQVKTQISQQVSAVAGATASPQARQVAEGADTTPPPTYSLKNYAVAPSLPRALYISKLHIASRVLPMGVNPDGSVQAPINIYDAGWYTGSVHPGEIGAMLIDGHSTADHEALFGNLGKLVEGDTLQLEKGDGTRLTYKVIHTAVVDLNKVDMKQMLLPYGNALRALNLITCAGTWVQSSKTLTQRVEVFTEQI